nr:hypothetical protein Iba_chr07fCG3770 [Ipomoea batatas]
MEYRLSVSSQPSAARSPGRKIGCGFLLRDLVLKSEEKHLMKAGELNFELGFCEVANLKGFSNNLRESSEIIENRQLGSSKAWLAGIGADLQENEQIRAN